MWCCRVPGKACSPPRPTTPSSPSRFHVLFSMLWEKPTSASWWTFTVSHTVVISLCSISCGPLHSLRSRVRGIKHTVVVSFSPSSFSPFSPTALLLSVSLSLFQSLSPVGPILLVEPQPKTVDVDSDVTLNCKWAGNPPLTLTWFKKGSNMVRS